MRTQAFAVMVPCVALARGAFEHPNVASKPVDAIFAKVAACGAPIGGAVARLVVYLGDCH